LRWDFVIMVIPDDSLANNTPSTNIAQGGSEEQSGYSKTLGFEKA
jgi:hypothetical protein